MKILHLEDNEDDAILIRRLVRSEWPDCQIVWVDNRTAFIAELERSECDLIVSDYALPSLDGFEALRLAKARLPDTPFIVVSGTIGEDRGIEAVRLGADDYVIKDAMKRLLTAIARALRDMAAREERRRAERRIRDQAEMLNQARDAIFVTDLGNRVIYWNAGAERTYGWSATEAVGRTVSELIDPRVLSSHQCTPHGTLPDGEWHGELHVRNRAHEPLVIESRQSLIHDDAGQPKARLCITSDITEKKRLEEQFLRAQRMENLGLLAAGIAHDLNNMLAPILLASPMLREYVADEAAQRLLDTLEKSAERGAMLVRQILSFAHGIGGEHELLQVKHLMRDIAAVASGTFPKSIRLDEYVPSDLWPIKGNPTQIHQVLMNLCVNARDAMPSGGTLRLVGENCVLSVAAAAAIPGGRPGPYLVITVSDTGTGIPPDVLKRIWEPFFTTKEAGRGTGLGLPTVAGIVGAHHGFVEVTSEPGKGSCFRVYLPAAESQVPDIQQFTLRSLPRGDGELILVVDDEQQIRDMTSEILSRHGYRVMVAVDGVEAASLFARQPRDFCVVISDLHMPNLDGAMLARAVRRMNPNVRLLFMSGLLGGLADRSEYRIEDSATALLLKPFKPETLLERVHELLDVKVAVASG